MEVKKFRWSRVYESSEEELQSFLKKKSINAERWSLEAGEIAQQSVYAQPKILWCAEGSLSVVVNERSYSIQPGDALSIPAMTYYGITAGFGGSAVYEFPLQTDNPAL